jgi:pimeloyl-ACP methyl ester carboxylesterase
LAVDGRELEVAWWGDINSTRPTMVLLHEGLGSVAMWRDFPAAITARTRCPVMAYSRLGHGTSDPPAAPHTVGFMHDEARRLPAILDAAGVGQPILFGHSDGASIALIFAAEHPERARALILEAPHVFVEDVSVASIERVTAAYETTDLRNRLAKYHRDADVAFRGWSDVWLHPEFLTWNLEALLPRATCPVLLIQGDRDEYGTLRQIDAIARQVSGPAARLELANCGHSPHRDQREAVLDAVAGFIDRWT